MPPLFLSSFRFRSLSLFSLLLSMSSLTHTWRVFQCYTHTQKRVSALSLSRVLSCSLSLSIFLSFSLSFHSHTLGTYYNITQYTPTLNRGSDFSLSFFFSLSLSLYFLSFSLSFHSHTLGAYFNITHTHTRSVSAQHRMVVREI